VGGRRGGGEGRTERVAGFAAAGVALVFRAFGAGAARITFFWPFAAGAVLFAGGAARFLAVDVVRRAEPVFARAATFFLRAAAAFRLGAGRFVALVRLRAGRRAAVFFFRPAAGRRERAGLAARFRATGVFFLFFRERAVRGRDVAFLAAMTLYPLCPVDPGPLSRG
jgi:hypothetical protein